MYRAEIATLQQYLVDKDLEIDALKGDAGEGPERQELVAVAVRQAESAAAVKALEESRIAANVERELNEKLHDTLMKLDGVQKRYTSLSEKFAQREDVIVELRTRMDEYECGVHGLREEVQEKEKLKTLHDQRSEEVRRLVGERNRRESQLAELAQETTWLREQCSIKPGDPKFMDLSELRLQSQIEVEKLKSQVIEYEEELQNLEKERTLMLKKLRVKALDRGERAAREQLSVEKLATLEEMSDLVSDPDVFQHVRCAPALSRGCAPLFWSRATAAMQSAYLISCPPRAACGGSAASPRFY